MTQGPLVNREKFHDACGTGFIVTLNGRADKRILPFALNGLKRLSHRGAISADGKTGDGSGILTDIPAKFFRNILATEFNYAIPNSTKLAVGMVFTYGREKKWLEKIVKDKTKELGISLIGIRNVPTDLNHLGEIAKKSKPTILQYLFTVKSSRSEKNIESRLYLLRKLIEGETLSRKKKSYFCSLSSKTIVYKGLMSSDELDKFYPDLRHPNFVVKMAMFHERFSTNTESTWEMAQPFRMVAHNGEFNTIKGNRLWMKARENELKSTYWGNQLKSLFPIVNSKGSDSQSFDQAIEFLTRSSRKLFHSFLMLIPDPHFYNKKMKKSLRDFYIYHENIIEPWDGPAAIVFTDGDIVGAKMDRNGLRPLRYSITKGGLVVMASEAGIIDIDDNDLLVHHHMASSEIFGVSISEKKVLKNHEIKTDLATRRSYSKLVNKNLITLDRKTNEKEFGQFYLPKSGFDQRIRVALGWSKEDLTRFLIPMATSAREPIGSMGDDTPLPMMSEIGRRFYDHFKQMFAQVTNPPIDPIREQRVMALFNYIGSEENLLNKNPRFRGAMRTLSPVLSPSDCDRLSSYQYDFPQEKIYCHYKKSSNIEGRLKRIRNKCLEAVNRGAKMIILSDENLNEHLLPIPMPIVVSDVHHYLVNKKVRSKVSLVCYAGDVVEDHHIAVLVGLGASTIYPYMAYELIREHFREADWIEHLSNYRYALEKGLLKIMSKMGISTISSYQGSMLFNIVGLNEKIAKKYFPSLESHLGGHTFSDIHSILLNRNEKAFDSTEPSFIEKGLYRFRNNGELHGFAPKHFKWIHQIIRQKSVHRPTDSTPVYIRDLFQIKSKRNSIDCDQVESIENILRRFGSGAISFGAISDESHRELARGMYLVGGRSNTGEGGEMVDRYSLTNPDKSTNSFVKQVASGRFGVSSEYLSAGQEIQIKMAQGAKPGEGGQLPGHKVSLQIANARFATPGIPLISPPPHHDIYSIEDIKQLIHDLKEVNPRAKISVKLVSQPGIGVIASGVVKAGADIVLVSGGDGGTGASPLTSLVHTGFPWEYGLAEVHQTLSDNQLRDQTILRVDGGLKTGKDIITAALLGAEEFDFGTSLLVALGCVMARQCHLNTCPAGIATQEEAYLKKFKGKAEHVQLYLNHVAKDIQNQLSQLGFIKIQALIGRTDLLFIDKDYRKYIKNRGIDLSKILNKSNKSGLPLKSEKKIHFIESQHKKSIDETILDEARPALLTHGHAVISRHIQNKDRSVGTRLSGEITFIHGRSGFKGEVQCLMSGVGGQSFGAFLTDGVELRLKGVANDFVGKGMSGGRITIRMPKEVRLRKKEFTVMGNVALYGATGGSLYVSGRCGERFAVRNSGASAVVEGIGNHGCEYMTRGTVIVLGDIGINFGAGMTGGLAFIYSKRKSLTSSLNIDFVSDDSLNVNDERMVKRLIRNHDYHTRSPIAKKILKNWAEEKNNFRKIIPHSSGNIDFEKIYNEKIKDRLGIYLNE
ncbi:MAG: glutamate synthase large subunit [Candidatus Marinimicrobia bacterium]|nr:glutamate synthase large subunit [Candidatus Neomarinimicrobiota bacterium]